jgi:hypothetical protein
MAYHYYPADPTERKVYEQLWHAADTDGNGSIGGHKAVVFLKKSGLEVDVLREIWSLSTTSAAINQPEFFTALRYITLVQSGEWPMSKGKYDYSSEMK